MLLGWICTHCAPSPAAGSIVRIKTSKILSAEASSTLSALLAGDPPALDEYQCPVHWYGLLVHQGCIRNEYHEHRVEESDFGARGCLFFHMGCRGPLTHGLCNKTLWNRRSSKPRAGVQLPPGAVRIRSIAMMTEQIQSDVRQPVLMFAADFVNPAYASHSLYDEAVRRVRPFEGELTIETIRATKRAIEIIAIIGGQWPHSSYMVPGGIASVPSDSDLLQCRMLLKQYRRWYEQWILCGLCDSAMNLGPD